MQTLWSRATTPTASCRCILCLKSTTKSTASALTTRRTTTAIARQPWNTGQIFGVFMLPVLGTAAVWDAVFKKDRIEEWDRKIAEVKGDIQRMQEDEARILKQLEPKRQRRKRLPLKQVRSYSTTARPIAKSDEDGLTEQVEEGPRVEETPEWIENLLDKEEGKSGIEKFNEDDTAPDHGYEYQDSRRMRKIRQLIARRLALVILLRPSMQIYMGRRHAKNYTGNLHEHIVSQDNAALLEQLSVNQRELDLWRHTDDASKLQGPLRLVDVSETAREERQSARRALDRDMTDLTKLYNYGSIDMFEFLYRVAQNLLSSTEPPTSWTYNTLITHFTQDRQHDLADAVIESFIEGRMRCTDYTVNRILTYYSRTKNAKCLDQFTRLLHNKAQMKGVTRRWQWFRLGGEQVLVPPAPRIPSTMNILFYGALKLDRPHHAAVYLEVMRESGFGQSYIALGCFLQHWAYRFSWKNGVKYLARALTYPFPTEDLRNSLDHFVLTMLHFCYACGERQLYKKILEAAVQSGLDWEKAHARALAIRDHPKWQVLLIDWKKAQEEFNPYLSREMPSEEKAQSLTAKLAPLADHLSMDGWLSHLPVDELQKGHAAGAILHRRVAKVMDDMEVLESQTQALKYEIQHEVQRAQLASLTSTIEKLRDEQLRSIENVDSEALRLFMRNQRAELQDMKRMISQVMTPNGESLSRNVQVSPRASFGLHRDGFISLRSKFGQEQTHALDERDNEPSDERIEDVVVEQQPSTDKKAGTENILKVASEVVTGSPPPREPCPASSEQEPQETYIEAPEQGRSGLATAYEAQSAEADGASPGLKIRRFTVSRSSGQEHIVLRPKGIAVARPLKFPVAIRRPLQLRPPTIELPVGAADSSDHSTKLNITTEQARKGVLDAITNRVAELRGSTQHLCDCYTDFLCGFITTTLDEISRRGKLIAHEILVLRPLVLDTVLNTIQGRCKAIAVDIFDLKTAALDAVLDAFEFQIYIWNWLLAREFLHIGVAQIWMKESLTEIENRRGTLHGARWSHIVDAESWRWLRQLAELRITWKKMPADSFYSRSLERLTIRNCMEEILRGRQTHNADELQEMVSITLWVMKAEVKHRHIKDTRWHLWAVSKVRTALALQGVRQEPMSFEEILKIIGRARRLSAPKHASKTAPAVETPSPKPLPWVRRSDGWRNVDKPKAGDKYPIRYAELLKETTDELVERDAYNKSEKHLAKLQSQERYTGYESR